MNVIKVSTNVPQIVNVRTISVPTAVNVNQASVVMVISVKILMNALMGHIIVLVRQLVIIQVVHIPVRATGDIKEMDFSVVPC